MKPPRSLWVSFSLGRPLGVPNDVAFQHRVIGAALDLLNAERGPVLEDFPEDAPHIEIDDTPACPVTFARPASNTNTWQAALLAELQTLTPWHDLGKRKRGGRTLVGISGPDVKGNLEKLGQYLDDSKLPISELKWFKAAIEDLKSKGLIYQGVLEPPKGKKPEDWEPREQTLFRSTDHGDDVDRPVQKSDGSWTYFAPDIAYHYDKVQRGFDQLIDVFGADHGGYVKRMKAAVSALSNDKISLDIKLTQLVKLFKNGEPFKMSKRAGTFVSLRDLVDQVGADATRFVMLTRKNDAPLDFDFDKVMEQTKENPVFYVQYAHARICSVMRKAKLAGVPVEDAVLQVADLAGLTDTAELALAAKLSEFPRLIEIAARSNEPHRIAFYLYDLASEFHALWNKGNEQPELRFLQEGNLATSQAKIALIRATAVVISNGLGILGVQPAQEMR